MYLGQSHKRRSISNRVFVSCFFHSPIPSCFLKKLRFIFAGDKNKENRLMKKLFPITKNDEERANIFILPFNAIS